MVDEDIVGAGVKNRGVIASMRKTPRHEFVPAGERDNAYFDMALPIGAGQTISPPFIVAYMTEQLDPQPTDKVLEIGTGSGFQAAVLRPWSTRSIRSRSSKRSASAPPRRSEAAQVHRTSSPRSATATRAGPSMRRSTRSSSPARPRMCRKPLVDQLKEGGRMIVPLGERYQQTLYLFRKEDGKLVSEALRPTLFVPMTGTAEDKRQVKPDPLHPAIVNGGFEDSGKDADDMRSRAAGTTCDREN